MTKAKAKALASTVTVTKDNGKGKGNATHSTILIVCERVSGSEGGAKLQPTSKWSRGLRLRQGAPRGRGMRLSGARVSFYTEMCSSLPRTKHDIDGGAIWRSFGKLFIVNIW